MCDNARRVADLTAMIKHGCSEFIPGLGLSSAPAGDSRYFIVWGVQKNRKVNEFMNELGDALKFAETGRSSEAGSDYTNETGQTQIR